MVMWMCYLIFEDLAGVLVLLDFKLGIIKLVFRAE